MSIVLNILKWITYATVGLVAFAFVLLVYDMSSGPTYDDDDPRYQALVAQRAKIRDALESGIGPARIDLSSLNGGEWTTACIFGGYNDPLEKMIERGARVSEADRARLRDLESGFRINQVEEFEIMFVFIDLSGTAQFVHFAGGIGSNGQHLERCITKPQTVIDLRGA